MKHTAQNADAGKGPPAFAIVPRHIWLDRSLTNADRAVYDALAARAGGEDKRDCWPGTDRVITESGVSAGTVSKSLIWLIHRGHVERFRAPQAMPDGRQAVVTTYRLPWTNETEATKEDRVAFFQDRHPSRRERAFPSVEVSPGGNSTGGNQHVSTGGNGAIPPVETQKFPYGETQKNRPVEQTSEIKPKIRPHTPPAAAASQTAGDGRIKISLDLAPPERIYRMKEFRDTADGAQRADAAWREFLGERLKEDPEWIAAYPNTYLGRFRDFVRLFSYREARAKAERMAAAQAQERIKMSWDWKKRPEFPEVWSYALKVGFTTDDALLQIDRFVRDRMGKDIEKTAREWKMDAANWLDSGMQYCLQNGTYVKRASA